MIESTAFYGREHELGILERFLNKGSATLLVIKGRRRIGKSRLLKEFAKNFGRAYFFSGLPPTSKTTAQSQREEFARQLQRASGLPPVKADDWGDLLWFLAETVKSGKALVVLDEINWMGSSDPDFLGKLKNAWDLYFSNNPKLILVICGSLSVWIEENILASTGFMGRYGLDLTLEELPLDVCNQFWKGLPTSAYEKFIVLSITGGIPRYLEFVDPKLTAERNIQHMCFDEGSFMLSEFEKIFSDLFSARKRTYKNIVEVLATGAKTQGEIITALEVAKSGEISEYLDNLVKSRIISRDFTWNIENKKQSSLSVYRLSDNYSRFYLNYIQPNSTKISAGNYRDISLVSLPGWNTILGLQFENMVLNNRDRIKRILGIKNEEIVNDNPYFQKKTLRQGACQIDYLIQTTTSLYIIEIKFSRNKIKSGIINQVKEKINRLNNPTNLSIRPVLIQVNGTEEALRKSDFFVKIIDFSAFLE